MIGMLQAEAVKMRHRWMPRILILIMLAVIALLFWGIGTGSNRNDLLFPRSLVASLVFGAFVAPFLWPVLAGAWSGNEYGWGTVRLILTRRPNRVEYVLSSVVVLILTATLALLLALVVGLIGGGIVALVTGHSFAFTVGLSANFWLTVVKTFVVILYVITYYLILAFAAGTIFQSPAAGIGIGIGSWIAQQVISGIFDALGNPWKSIADHFPVTYTSSALERVVSGSLGGRFIRPTAGSPGEVQSIIALAIYMAILAALTLYFITTRDVTS